MAKPKAKVIKEIPAKIKEVKELPLKDSRLEKEIQEVEGINAPQVQEISPPLASIEEITPIIRPTQAENIRELSRTPTAISQESQTARENFSQNIIYDTRLHQEHPVYSTPERATARRVQVARQQAEQFSPVPQAQQEFKTLETARLRGEQEKAYHAPLDSAPEKPKRRYPWEA